MRERVNNELWREAVQFLGKFNEEGVSVVSSYAIGVLAGDKQLVPYVFTWGLVAVAYPIEVVVKAINLRKMIEDRIVFTAVSNNKPSAASTGVLKNRGKQTGMAGTLLFSVQQNEPRALSVQVDYSRIRHVSTVIPELCTVCCVDPRFIGKNECVEPPYRW